MKTIKQIADELGVSKQAVHKRIKKEPLSTSLQGLMTTVDGVVYISVDGQNELYKILKAELTAKNEQLAALQAELAVERKHSRELSAQLVVLAEQAQQLHAGTIQQQLIEGSTDSEESDVDFGGVQQKRNWFKRLFGKI